MTDASTETISDRAEIISDRELATILQGNLDNPGGSKPRLPGWKVWAIGAGLAIAVLAIVTTAFLSILLYTSSQNHHAQTIQQNATITGLLSSHSGELHEIGVLAEQQKSVISNLPEADAILFAEVQYLNACIYHVSQGTGVACAPPPNVTLPMPATTVPAKTKR